MMPLKLTSNIANGNPRPLSWLQPNRGQTMRKSQLIGFLLTPIFGPLGLFYSSVAAAIGCILLAIALGAVTAGIGTLVCWPISILVGINTVGRYNVKIEVEEKRHKELLEATKPGNSL